MEQIDTETPQNVKLSAKYKRSFAFHTVKDRLPIILTKVLDSLVRDKETIIAEYGENASEDLKTVIGGLSKLKYEIQTNKSLSKLETTAPDIEIWNNYLSKCLKTEINLTYFNTDWLYCECYMYRKIKEIFDLSVFKDFDYFQKQKNENFVSSLQAIITVSSFLITEFSKNLFDKELQILFSKLMKLSLWGNKCDLSLSAGADSSQTSDPLASLDRFDNFIILNDSNTVFDILNKFQNNLTGVISFVTDNAGYELFTDLCLADFLINAQLSTQIRFHVKSMPWYISDVTPNDFHWLIDTMSKSNHNSLSLLGKRWKNYLQSKQWTVHSEIYWTLPFEYCKMKTEDRALYSKLSEAKLIIFKGDLNYRKLLADINWEPTTSFKDCLQGFHPTNLCALRTNKSDLIAGLPEGAAERIKANSPDWLISGQYGVIQCFSKFSIE